MENARHVLVIEEEPSLRQTLLSLLAERRIETFSTIGAEEALAALAAADFDAILAPDRLPGRASVELVRELRELRPETPVIVLTSAGSTDSGVDALQAGAFGTLARPPREAALLATLERAFEHRALERENRRLRRALDRTSKLGDLLGTSPAMREIFALIRKLSGSRSNVLISGESGTGKGVVARALHFTSSHADGPFIPVSCTAMPEELLVGELFGHAPGSSADSGLTRKGLLEEADGGTLFLDEIGELPPGLQARLLRALQDPEVRPLAGKRPIDVRIVSATSRDLKRAVGLDRFRKDLYYRLNVIPIRIPPLRERREDIPLLAEAFVRQHGGKMARITPRALEKLTRHPWEGNARELENVIERALALAAGSEIEADDISLRHTGGPRSEPEDLEASLLGLATERQLTIRELTDLYIAETLKRTGGNKVQAARLLGINRRTLYRRGSR